MIYDTEYQSILSDPEIIYFYEKRLIYVKGIITFTSLSGAQFILNH
jgi:hypothetical protein